MKTSRLRDGKCIIEVDIDIMNKTFKPIEHYVKNIIYQNYSCVTLRKVSTFINHESYVHFNKNSSCIGNVVYCDIRN